MSSKSSRSLPKPLAAGGDASAKQPGPPRIESRSLFGDAGTVLIEHEGETYQLRRTRLGKLILTK